jgi:hypothetical protein
VPVRGLAPLSVPSSGNSDCTPCVGHSNVKWSRQNLFERIQMPGESNPIFEIAVRAANVKVIGLGSAGEHASLMLCFAAEAA